MMQEFKRGDIFYVEKSGSRAASGSNQPEGRPALIVSNDRFNKTSDILEVVYLTYNPRNDLPTHVTIRQNDQRVGRNLRAGHERSQGAVHQLHLVGYRR